MTRWWWLLGGILIAAGLGDWVVQVTMLDTTDRANASGYGQFVLAIVGLLIIVAEHVARAFRTTSDTPRQPPLDQLVDDLAVTMLAQWTQAARERRLEYPSSLPIRWRRCATALAGPPVAPPRGTPAAFPPLPGARRVHPRQLTKGTRAGLHRLYSGLASGRLIIVGKPGAGKSSAAILLLLDALRYREQCPPEDRLQIPVPVLFTLHTWNPLTTPLDEWLAAKLTESLMLRGRRGRHRAAELLRTGRLAIFLDGLDEIPADARPPALRALSEQASYRLVLLSRTTELADAAQHHILTNATAVELQPLTSADVIAYLLQPLVEPAPRPWRELTQHLRAHPDSPAARALTSPLTVTLLRDIYPPDTPTTPAAHSITDLIDPTRFPHADDLVHFLLDQAIDVAYLPRPGQPAPPYTPGQARHDLTVIAQHLNERGTRDLAWWTVSGWVPRLSRNLLNITFCTLTCLLIVGLGAGLIWGLFAGAVLGYANAIDATQRPELLAPIRFNRSRIGKGMTLTAVATLCATVVGGLPSLVAVGITGIAVSTIGFWMFGPSTIPDTVDPIILWRGSLRLHLVLGLTLGLIGGLAWALASGLADRVSDWLAALHGGSIASLASIGITGDSQLWPTFGLPEWLAYGLQLSAAGRVLFGIVFGTMLSLLSSPSWALATSQLYLHFRRGMPFRIMRFLEDARTRHLLRTVGPVYQFRHANLQDQLTPQPPT